MIENLIENRKLLLQHLLAIVPFDGWSDFALKEAAKKANLNTAEVKQAFAHGIKDCIDFFLDEEDRILKENFSDELIASMRIPQRIEAIITKRLSNLLPKREAVRRTLATLSMPWNAINSSTYLYRTVDVMWRIAGDKSTDFNFYTKRATLAGVYSSTLLFWLNDNSENQQDTLEFLQRRLSNVADFGKFKKELTNKFKFN